MRRNSSIRVVVAILTGSVFTLFAREEVRSQAGDLVLSEILASNASVLEDEDGDYSDWIEVYNAGVTAVNLDDWSLTDDPLDLAKWRFPAVSLAADGFLLVFASGKDRAVAGAELHASFKLASEGGYLALVRPNGTVAWEYNNYPAQVDDYSYGLKQDANSAVLLASGAAATAFIPANGTLGLTWTEQGFGDGGWIAGTTGVGYDRQTTYLGLIGLDVRTQMDNVLATAYIRVPFTVSAGSSFTALRLRMQYDDGFIVYLNGVEVARRNAPTSPTWNSGATTTNDDADAVIFEGFDLPGFASLLEIGTNVLAIHGLNSGAGSSDFLIVPELDGFDSGDLDRTVRQYFHQPTPGSGNVPGYPGIAGTPLFSRPGGVFTGPLNVTLSAVPAQGVIRYTTNGSVPVEASTAYSGPIAISSSTLLRARVFDPGLAPGPLVSEGYVALAADVQNFTSDIPIVLLENFGAGGVPGNSYQFVYMAIFEPTVDRASLRNAPDLGTRAGIKIRGSSTAGQPKPNLALETWDEKNADRDTTPLGFPSESDWILHAPYNFDLALMRNPFIFELSNQVGRYAVRTRFVEVYLNTGGGPLAQADYMGVYSFMEKIKRGPDRVDVEKMPSSYVTEPLVTGGYMSKIDRLDPGDSGFDAGGQRMGWVYPKEELVAPAQAAWYAGYVNAFVNVLNGAGYRDPVNGYIRYIDPDSWVDHHILNVLAMNVDALRLSGYMFKGRERRLEMGPIWDFDRSMNSTDGRDDNPLTWKGTGDATDFFNYPWWQRLFTDLDFWQRWKDRWQAFRRNQLSAANMNAVIDSMANEVRESQARNFQRWSLLGGRTWQGEVNLMKQWLSTRANWIDSQFLAAPVLSNQGGPIAPGFTLSISAAVGTIYFTTDGTDPRAPAGLAAARAATYSGPITLDANARVVARATRSASDWSGPAAGTFVVETPRLVVSELMYHPLDPAPGSPHDADDFEFVELLNAWDKPIRLAGARLSGGVSFTFSASDTTPLAPGDRVVVVKDIVAFSTRYDTSPIRIGGEYSGNLGNAGDDLRLEGPLLEPILFFSYSELWYPTTDGDGDSLVIVDPQAPFTSWGNAPSWTAGGVTGGTPGADESGAPPSGFQVPGDSNQDAIIDISDALSLLLRLFGGGGRPLPCDGASAAEGGNLLLLDLNGDAGLNVSDVIHLLSYLFQNGPPPSRGAACQRIVGCPNACGS